MSVDPVYSRWCTEIKVGEKLIDVGWPASSPTKDIPTMINYSEQGMALNTNINEFVKTLGLGMFAQVI